MIWFQLQSIMGSSYYLAHRTNNGYILWSNSYLIIIKSCLIVSFFELKLVGICNRKYCEWCWKSYISIILDLCYISIGQDAWSLIFNNEAAFCESNTWNHIHHKWIGRKPNITLRHPFSQSHKDTSSYLLSFKNWFLDSNW